MKLVFTEKGVNKVFDKKIAEIKMSPEQYLVPNDETFRMAENYAWYYYNSEQLLEFYNLYFPLNSLSYQAINYFYRVKGLNNDDNSPVCHFNLASMITNTMANLVFSKSPVISFNKSALTDAEKEQNKLVDDELQDILKDNKSREMFYEAAQYKSYSGAVGFKLVLDSDVSDYPIIVTYPKERIEVIKKYERVQEISFIDIYYDDINNKNSCQYKLYSRYGKGYIKYSLYRANGVKLKEVPLDTLEETEDLKDIEIKCGSKLSKKIYAVYLENGSNGKSDYIAIKDDFSSIDETYSNMINFIRKSNIITYRPENTLKLNTKTGKKEISKKYNSSEIIRYDSNPEDKPIDIVRDIPDISNSLTAYQTAMTAIIKNACIPARLSPATLGIDPAGANASGEALEIRERVTLHTRDEMIGKWSPTLSDLCSKFLELNRSRSNGDSTIVISEEFDNAFTVDFGKYLEPTYSEKVTSLGAAKDAGLIDQKTALEQLYPELNDDEINNMIELIANALPTSGSDIEDNELDNEDNEDNEEEKEGVDEDNESSEEDKNETGEE